MGRIRKGIFIVCTDKKPGEKGFVKEIDTSEDKASLMVESVLSEVNKVAEIYSSLKDQEVIRAAVAFPFPDRKQRYSEEILIGLTKGDPKYPKHNFDDKRKPASADNDL